MGRLGAETPDAGGTERRPGRLKRLGGRYSRFVGAMKVVLPLIAGVLVTLVVIWPQLSGEVREGFRIGVSSLKMEKMTGQAVERARFTGVDRRNNPYTVTAERASQAPGETDVIALRAPKADITTQSEAWVAVAAPAGTYNKESQILRLNGGVNLFHDQGYEFATDEAVIDFSKGVAWGNSAVTGQGPFGELNAAGFYILEEGERIIFTGQSRLVIYPGEKGIGRDSDG